MPIFLFAKLIVQDIISFLVRTRHILILNTTMMVYLGVLLFSRNQLNYYYEGFMKIFVNYYNNDQKNILYLLLLLDLVTQSKIMKSYRY